MSQSIWGATDRGPAAGTMRLPVDTGASSTPGYLTVTEMASFVVVAPTVVRIVTAAGAVTITTADNVVILNKTSGAATVANLPAAPAAGSVYIIKDGKGDADTNPITLTPNAGTIDGQSTAVINVPYGALTVVYSGTEWSIIG